MSRAALVLVLVALACSRGGEDSKSAGPPPAAAPDSGGVAPDTATAEVGKTITLPSGVMITHRVIGSGASPHLTDRITVHYHGTLPDDDGKVFDSTVDRGQPASFSLSGRVIDCWTQALPMIHVGGKAQLICPPQTAFGARGLPPRIPPWATLQFEVELIAIQ
jgi:FKBP-type peptidyl-prolyl cis-trans isomerase FkpA